MEESFRKYARLLLEGCLGIKAGQPLLVLTPIEAYPFLRVLAEEAYMMGVKDIYFDYEDEVLKRQQLENLSFEEIDKSSFWNKAIFDEYAKKDAAFLTLCNFENEDLSRIHPALLGYVGKRYVATRPYYKKLQRNYDISWCFAAVATTGWAKKMFPNSQNSLEKLWNEIFKICLVDRRNPVREWGQKIQKNKEYSEWLNSLSLKSLHYENGLGTDFQIELPKNHIWVGAGKKMPDGRNIIVNMPSEEVFTCPLVGTAEGVLKASKPLVYNGALINDFELTFRDGKVIDVKAKEGAEILKQIIKADDGACELGEVALVNYDSPISRSGLIFYETLYDENAACHFALGSSFPKCLHGTLGKTIEELQKMGLNQSAIHVDFMVGTEDLNITGINNDGKKILVMKNGNIRL